MGFGLLRFRFEEIVTDIGSGEVKIRTDLIQQAISGKKFSPDRIITISNRLKERIDRDRKGHQCEKSAKASQ